MIDGLQRMPRFVGLLFSFDLKEGISFRDYLTQQTMLIWFHFPMCKEAFEEFNSFLHVDLSNEVKDASNTWRYPRSDNLSACKSYSNILGVYVRSSYFKLALEFLLS
jgi:hypothetical protein